MLGCIHCSQNDAKIGTGKTTVEVLDRGEETPRSPPPLSKEAANARERAINDTDRPIGEMPPSIEPKTLQAITTSRSFCFRRGVCVGVTL